MENKIVTTKIEVYSYDELNETDRNLVEQAKKATETSYAPYSKFNVGAAVLLENGETISGSNQENAAFPSGTCAERTTIFYASARFPGVRFCKLAIAAFTDGEFVEEPISPCGACRQAILEYEKLGGQPIEILLAGRNKVYKLQGIRSLLPLSFEEF
ncbi:MAG: cytidine deaminase [Muribaculaceae bacterium]|jgi:cytidine deaminase|nr:cytidine deaminase [Muribaculaceae bacterium]